MHFFCDDKFSEDEDSFFGSDDGDDFCYKDDDDNVFIPNIGEQTSNSEIFQPINEQK